MHAANTYVYRCCAGLCHNKSTIGVP